MLNRLFSHRQGTHPIRTAGERRTMNTPINSVGVNGGYTGYGTSPLTKAAAAMTQKQQTAGSSTDEVILSSNETVGRHLSELLGFPTLDELSAMKSSDTSSVIRLEDIRNAYNQTFNEFQQRLGSLLKEAGVDRSILARLQTDAGGNVVVTNDHPDEATIEQLFRENPDLANQFRGLSGLFSLLSAAEEHSEFTGAYEQNPYAAVAEFSELFAGQKSPFELLIGPNAIEAGSTED